MALRRQHTWAASGVFDDDQFSRGDNASIEGAELRKAFADEPGEETFTLALAGDGELPVGRAFVTLSADTDLRGWSERLERASQAADAATDEARARGDAEVGFMRREIAVLRAQLAAGEAELARLTGIEAQLARVLPALQEHEVVVRDHQAVLNSLSWRLTAPLRSLLARPRR